MRFQLAAAWALCMLVTAGCTSPKGPSGSKSARLADIETSEQAFRKMLEQDADLDWMAPEVGRVVRSMSMVRQGRSPRDKFFRRTEGSDTTDTDGSGRYSFAFKRYRNSYKV